MLMLIYVTKILNEMLEFMIVMIFYKIEQAVLVHLMHWHGQGSRMGKGHIHFYRPTWSDPTGEFG